MVTRYVGRKFNSASFLLISRVKDGAYEIIGVILMVDDLHNWGPPGSWTVVSDILLSKDLAQELLSQDLEVSRMILSKIYLKLIEWMEFRKRLVLSWSFENSCLEGNLLC